METAPAPTPTPTSLGHGLLVMGDLWNLLIVREALAGPVRFGDLKAALAISDPVLTRRLRDLLADGVLAADGPRQVYRLTDAGEDLWPAFVAINAWDRRWAPTSPLRVRVRPRHLTCGHGFDPIFGCGACGAIGVSARDTAAARDPAVPAEATNPRRRYHRSAAATGGASPIAAAAVLADRTSTSILAAAFLGIHRFGDFQRVMHDTAPHTLTTRLGLLTDEGILTKTPLQEGARRTGYRLTPKGHDFFPTFAFLIAWSEQRFSADGLAGVRITHRTCGEPLVPRWTCNACNGEISAKTVDVGHVR
ncbi:winged helix-turn-helix transcriptional regulator [Embleya sp. NBC_00896]|uniref:winged helix-turn-helix transcriptional regulator n=1 Tax=Embleya sp. NBC_00896 TaxID=2975961 RepID=UPI00386D443D|nr:winged helix-turn-helix transcriptional regulator [Embleya sp. NBC_00896]